MRTNTIRNRAFQALGIGIVLGAAGLGGVMLAHADPAARETVVFVCLHGSVKSQMAAAQFNHMAKERGLSVTAISRAVAADKEIPDAIRAGLAGDGLAPVSEIPTNLTLDEATHAIKVFAFDDVPADRRGTANITRWSDVPPATKNYSLARDAIVRHVEDAIDLLATELPAPHQARDQLKE
jgi:arsenate reductase (thioredoxin)